MARDAVKPNTIYALQKADVIEMVKLEFPSRKELKQAAVKYIKSGFKVHYVMS